MSPSLPKTLDLGKQALDYRAKDLGSSRCGNVPAVRSGAQRLGALPPTPPSPLSLDTAGAICNRRQIVVRFTNSLQTMRKNNARRG